MSGSQSLSRRRLLKGAGAMWLLSVSQVGFAAVSQVVAVRIWPASSYTRVTVESNRVLKYRQFALSNPDRLVVDLEGVNLNSVLKGMAAQIRGDDPFIKSARVGQFDPQTVRMVFELKQDVKPQLFALAPVANFKERLVMDLYPANANDVQDPLLALLEEYNKDGLEKQVPPAQSGPLGDLRGPAVGVAVPSSVPTSARVGPSMSKRRPPTTSRAPTWSHRSPTTSS